MAKVLASQGRGEEAEQEVREGLLFAERAGAPMIAGRFLMDLAEIFALTGKKDEATRPSAELCVGTPRKGASRPCVRRNERVSCSLLVREATQTCS